MALSHFNQWLLPEQQSVLYGTKTLQPMVVPEQQSVLYGTKTIQPMVPTCTTVSFFVQRRLIHPPKLKTDGVYQGNNRTMKMG